MRFAFIQSANLVDAESWCGELMLWVDAWCWCRELMHRVDAATRHQLGVMETNCRGQLGVVDQRESNTKVMSSSNNHRKTLCFALCLRTWSDSLSQRISPTPAYTHPQIGWNQVCSQCLHATPGASAQAKSYIEYWHTEGIIRNKSTNIWFSDGVSSEKHFIFFLTRKNSHQDGVDKKRVTPR